MHRSPLSPLARVSSLLLLTPSLFASGPFLPQRWLENGGEAVAKSPEFYWELELKRLALEFKVPEKRQPVAKSESEEIGTEGFGKQAAAADEADFKAALAAGKITAPDPAAATAQHLAARQIIAAANEASTETLGAEADSEFADYHKGAFAFRKGEAQWPEAAAAWQKLLQRPKTERQYRTIWATFMLGKLQVFKQDPQAAASFQAVRQLAAEGFPDSLGLAADSYGWEAKAALDKGDTSKAAELYLKQLATGDTSAIVSLKGCVPDRMGVDGMMSFPTDGAPAFEPAAIEEFHKSRTPQLEVAAKNAVLRRITTAHVLATETVGYSEGEGKSSRATNWLAAIQRAGIDKVEDADRLGWLAYTTGQFDQAASWLAKSDASSGTALWLKSKLLRRAGKTPEAVIAMTDALAKLRADSIMGDPKALTDMAYESFAPLSSAGGDLGALLLGQSQFVPAFDAFLNSDHWEDAAFVAERILTADELKGYVDAKFKPAATPAKKADDEYAPTPLPERTRHLLARRLVREDRYAEARTYMPEAHIPSLDQYTAALDKAANEKLSKPDRARAWWDAAALARFKGMELMGTEVEPDGACFGGDFEPVDIAQQREAGTYERTTFLNDGTEKKEKLPIAATVSTAEKERLTKFRPSPNKRFHYRYIGAALAWKAAALLPDQSVELADVLNSGGSWIKGDSPAADKFFQAIEHRASKTKVGKEAGKAHWFIESYGPWSQAPKVEP